MRTIAAPAAWDQGGREFHACCIPRRLAPGDLRQRPQPGARRRRTPAATSCSPATSISSASVELAALPPPDPPIDLMLAPHHGGKTANPSWLYSWASPRAVVVSQRPPAPGTTDALTPLERSGIPLLRTWQRGAVHFQWCSDHIITEGFLDRHDRPRSRPFARR